MVLIAFFTVITFLIVIGYFVYVFIEINTKGKLIFIAIVVAVAILILLSALNKRNNDRERAYNYGLTYIEKGEYYSAAQRLENLRPYKDSEVLYAYSEARSEMQEMRVWLKYTKGEEYVLSLLNSIPDDYSGPFYEEISETKEYVRSGEFNKEIVAKQEKAEAEAKKREAEEAVRRSQEAAANSNSGKKNNKYIYIPPTKSKPYYTDPDDYDCPEDFADDAWGLDFDDWDDAYDYWENY